MATHQDSTCCSTGDTRPPAPPSSRKGSFPRGLVIVSDSMPYARRPVVTRVRAHRQARGRSGDREVGPARRTLLLQHLVRIPDLDIFREPDRPAEQDLNDSAFNSVRGPGPQVLESGGTRVTKGRDTAKDKAA